MLVTIVSTHPDHQAETFDIGSLLITDKLCLKIVRLFDCDDAEGHAERKYRVTHLDTEAKEATVKDRYGDEVRLFFQEKVSNFSRRSRMQEILDNPAHLTSEQMCNEYEKLYEEEK